MSPASSLRVLAFGGEPCPALSLLSRVKHSEVRFSFVLALVLYSTVIFQVDLGLKVMPVYLAHCTQYNAVHAVNSVLLERLYGESPRGALPPCEREREREREREGERERERERTALCFLVQTFP